MRYDPRVPNAELKKRFRQFVRNGRWGACASCRQDSDGNHYPEFCEHTNRGDHQYGLEELVELYDKEQAEDPCPSCRGISKDDDNCCPVCGGSGLKKDYRAPTE